MSFSICENSSIILYGAGERCYEFYDFFKQKNHQILFIVDKEPQNVSGKFDCEVVSAKDVNWLDVCHSIVIVCMQNGLVHDRVARKLFDIGHKKIIFLPTGKKYNNIESMIDCYQKLLEKNLNYGDVIPDYEEMVMDNRQSALIKNDGEMVTCWVTMEYVFTSCNKKNNNDLFIKNNVTCWEPYIELFNYIGGSKKFPHKYLDFFRAGNDIGKQNLLKDRNELYKAYEEKLNTDSTYFTYAAPTAVWDFECGCFRIIDGHHRVVYLFLKGWYELPIRILKTDYDKYIEYRQVQPWCELEREQIVSLYKICSELIKWMFETNIVITDIYEEEETRQYVTWWIENNEMYKNRDEVTETNALVWCLKSETDISRLEQEVGNCYIITRKAIANKKDLKKCKELFCGFIGDIWDEVSVYSIK